jgi:hypothetical protein
MADVLRSHDFLIQPGEWSAVDRALEQLRAGNHRGAIKTLEQVLEGKKAARRRNQYGDGSKNFNRRDRRGRYSNGGGNGR